LHIALNHEVEPGWIITEGSGNPRSIVSDPGDYTLAGWRSAPSYDEVMVEVRRRVDRAVASAYGPNPTSKVVEAHEQVVDSVRSYEMQVLITINPLYRQTQALATRNERLWVVGVPTEAGVSIFLMSIPDRRADLWPRAAGIIGTLHII
jgi:hypothetical protein